MKILKYFQFSHLSESEEEKSYTFDELSPEAKKHAIDNNRDYHIDSHNWWDPIIEEFTEEIEAIGMTDIHCAFSGFYSQGDGASFTGKVKDNELFLTSIKLNPFDELGKGPRKNKFISDNIENALTEFYEGIYITIQRNDSRYYHYNTISANVEVDGEEEIEIMLSHDLDINIDVQKECDKLEPLITDWAREKSKDLYSSLETYHDELTSDEAIANDLRSGGHSFDEEGNMI